MKGETENLVRGWPILLALHYAGEIALHIKLQKILFLVLSEGKVKIPYNFTKHEYGPYDQEIEIDFLNLENQGYINVMRVSKPEKTYKIFSITQKGRDYANTIVVKSVSENDRKIIEKVVMKYSKTDWKKLVSMVYERFNLERPELERKREEIREELFRIRPLWEAHYNKSDCDHMFIALALIDYSMIMLGKKKFDSLDLTHYNVLINFMEETVSYLKREVLTLSPCPDRSRCEKLPETEELFQFSQYLGEKFRILPSTLSEDVDLDDFGFDEGDKLRISRGL